MSTHEYTDCQRAVCRTIAFFDVFEYPLTDTEIQKFLLGFDGDAEYTLNDVRACLASLVFLGALAVGEGLYHSVGRSALRELRRFRVLYSYRKYRRARRMGALLARVPFVRMVCVCNTLGLNAAKDTSDIDLFIVARAGHLWFVRLVCTGFAHLLGMRPREGSVRNMLCLSFYAADDALCLSALQHPAWSPDLYLAYWISWCVPLYDDGVYDDFFKANAWITSVLPNRAPYRPIPLRRIALSSVARFLKRTCERVIGCSGGMVERGARALQLRILPFAIKSQMNAGTGVVVSDSLLKFHTTDRRNEIREKFLRQCREMGL